MIFQNPMKNSGRPSPGTPAHAEAELRLDALLRSYRDACPVPEGSVNFMPDLWAKIDQRKSSATVFSRFARVLVTAALAATAILGIIISTEGSNGLPTQGVYMEALVTDGEAALNLLNPASLTDMEQQ